MLTCNDLFTACFHAKTVGCNDHHLSSSSLEQVISIIRFFLTLWHPLGFGDFWKKKPKRMWLRAGISLVWHALQTR